MLVPAQNQKFPGLSLRAAALVSALSYPTQPAVVKQANIASIGTTFQSTFAVVFTTPLATSTYIVDFQCTEKNGPAAVISARTVNGFTMVTSSAGASNEFAGASFSLGVYE